MYRSLVLIFTLLFFSVFIPCLCGVSAEGTHDPCVMSGNAMTRDHKASATGMNVLEQVSSWRAFFSVTTATFFLVFFLGVFSRVFLGKFSNGTCSLFRFDAGAFHPPEYFDERVLFSGPLFRALFSGVLHAKVSL